MPKLAPRDTETFHKLEASQQTVMRAPVSQHLNGREEKFFQSETPISVRSAILS